MPSLHEVVLYSRKNCHLCDQVKSTLARLGKRGSLSFVWKEVDVDSDPELVRQFGEQVPVVFIHGKKAFKYRMDERDFVRVLERRS